MGPSSSPGGRPHRAPSPEHSTGRAKRTPAEAQGTLAGSFPWEVRLPGRSSRDRPASACEARGVARCGEPARTDSPRLAPGMAPQAGRLWNRAVPDRGRPDGRSARRRRRFRTAADQRSRYPRLRTLASPTVHISPIGGEKVAPRLPRRLRHEAPLSRSRGRGERRRLMPDRWRHPPHRLPSCKSSGAHHRLPIRPMQRDPRRNASAGGRYLSSSAVRTTRYRRQRSGTPLSSRSPAPRR